MAYRSVVPKSLEQNLELVQKSWKPVYDRYSGSEAFTHASRTALDIHRFEVLADRDNDLSFQLNHIAMSHVFKDGPHKKRFPNDFHRYKIISRGFDTFNRLRDNDLSTANPESYAKILENPCLGLIVRMVDLVQYGFGSTKSEVELSNIDPKVFYVFKSGRGKTEYELIGNVAKNIYSPLADLFGYRQLAGELNRLYYFHIDRFTYDEVELALLQMKDKIEKTQNLLLDAIIPIADELLRDGFEIQVKFRKDKHPGKVMEKAERYARNHGTRIADEIHELHDLVAFTIILRKKNGAIVTQKDMEIFEYVGNVVTKNLNEVSALEKGSDGAKVTDMVTRPKNNGYQSYHIDYTFISSDFVNVEAIIRNERMEEYAEHGGAAHYLYKGGGELAKGIASTYKSVVKALQNGPNLISINDTSRQKRIKISYNGSVRTPIVDVNSTVAEALICADIDLLNGPRPYISYVAPIRDIDEILLTDDTRVRNLPIELVTILIGKAVYKATQGELKKIKRQLSKPR